MKISHQTRFREVDPNNGYGYATERILASLNNLGYEVTRNDANADVAFWFDQPFNWGWFDKPYKIGYHPWESTLLLPDWPEKMNECDEVWTPSPLVANWYREYNGITKPIYVYQHGIDSIWEPKPRKVEDKIIFLHAGGEGRRKGVDLTIKAFRLAFGKRDDVELLCKTSATGFNVNNPTDNVHSLNGKIPIEDLVKLHHDRHIFVYPSWGEGFGFNPFQAMATGMPTIMTADWAPYKRFVNPDLTINTQFVESPWQYVDSATGQRTGMHPGKMFKPNLDDLIDKMHYAVDNYDSIHAFAQEQAPKIHAEYAWDLVTGRVFKALEKRLQNRAS